MARLDANRLEEVRLEGKRCHEATLKFRKDVGPFDVKPAIEHFNRGMQQERRRGLDIQHHGVLHVRGDGDGATHYHVLFYTEPGEAEAGRVIQRWWRTAPGAAHDVHVKEIDSIPAATRYFYHGSGFARGRRILLRYGPRPFRRSIYSKDFFGSKKVYGVGGRKGLESRMEARLRPVTVTDWEATAAAVETTQGNNEPEQVPSVVVADVPIAPTARPSPWPRTKVRPRRRPRRTRCTPTPRTTRTRRLRVRSGRVVRGRPRARSRGS
jgi:hypothetical protein